MQIVRDCFRKVDYEPFPNQLVIRGQYKAIEARRTRVWWWPGQGQRLIRGKECLADLHR